jgi:hypothetical protein
MPRYRSNTGYQCAECKTFCKPDEMSQLNTDYCFDCDPTVEDDGQPSWEQEWADFGEVYDDDPNTI